jgi:hypothetical protein
LQAMDQPRAEKQSGNQKRSRRVKATTEERRVLEMAEIGKEVFCNTAGAGLAPSWEKGKVTTKGRGYVRIIKLGLGDGASTVKRSLSFNTYGSGWLGGSDKLPQANAKNEGNHDRARSPIKKAAAKRLTPHSTPAFTRFVRLYNQTHDKLNLKFKEGNDVAPTESAGTPPPSPPPSPNCIRVCELKCTIATHQPHCPLCMQQSIRRRKHCTRCTKAKAARGAQHAL